MTSLENPLAPRLGFARPGETDTFEREAADATRSPTPAGRTRQALAFPRLLPDRPRPPREKPVGGALSRYLPGMMPNKTPRKPAPPNAAPAGTAATDRRGHRARMALPAAATNATHLMSSHSSVAIHDPQVEDQSFRTYVRLPSYSEPEAVADCALQLRKIGDKLNLRQKILNLIAKLFCPGTRGCLE